MERFLVASANRIQSRLHDEGNPEVILLISDVDGVLTTIGATEAESRHPAIVAPKLMMRDSRNRILRISPDVEFRGERKRSLPRTVCPSGTHDRHVSQLSSPDLEAFLHAQPGADFSEKYVVGMNALLQSGKFSADPEGLREIGESLIEEIRPITLDAKQARTPTRIASGFFPGVLDMYRDLASLVREQSNGRAKFMVALVTCNYRDIVLSALQKYYAPEVFDDIFLGVTGQQFALTGNGYQLVSFPQPAKYDAVKYFAELVNVGPEHLFGWVDGPSDTHLVRAILAARGTVLQSACDEDPKAQAMKHRTTAAVQQTAHNYDDPDPKRHPVVNTDFRAGVGQAFLTFEQMVSQRATDIGRGKQGSPLVFREPDGELITSLTGYNTLGMTLGPT